MEIHWNTFHFICDKTVMLIIAAIPLMIVMSMKQFQDLFSGFKNFRNKRKEKKDKNSNSLQQRIDKITEEYNGNK